MVEISVTAEISDEKKILWWHCMIGSFLFCFQNFPFRSQSFGIGLYLILQNSSNQIGFYLNQFFSRPDFLSIRGNIYAIDGSKTVFFMMLNINKAND